MPGLFRVARCLCFWRALGQSAQAEQDTFILCSSQESVRTKGMYRQRIQKAWGHTAHRGWARLILNRARDLIIHGPAHRGANGQRRGDADRRG